MYALNGNVSALEGSHPGGVPLLNSSRGSPLDSIVLTGFGEAHGEVRSRACENSVRVNAMQAAMTNTRSLTGMILLRYLNCTGLEQEVEEVPTTGSSGR